MSQEAEESQQPSTGDPRQDDTVHKPERRSTDQPLKSSPSPDRKERSTWAGSEERSHGSKHQPIRIPSGQGKDGTREPNRSPHHYQQYLPSEGMYVTYEDQEVSKKGDSVESLDESIQVDGGATDRGRDTRNTFTGEIDGRFSFSGNVDDFVRVEINADTTSTSHELMECKKTVLKPYLVFLKVIGWRRFTEKAPDLNQDKFRLILNLLYPAAFFLLLIATIIIQLLTCYFRTQPANYIPGANQSHLIITCADHVVIDEIIPNILILTAYLYGVYIFRYGEPENLAALIETVFLSSSQQMSVSKKRIIAVLRSYLVLGSLWILLDFTLNGVRMYSLQLLEWNSFIPTLRIPPDREYNSTATHTERENVLRFFFVLIAPFGFVLFDLLYFAVVVAYASQSQLIQYYIISIIEKVRAKTYSLEDAIKDIRQTYTYLQVLNSKLSTLVTLMLFLFLSSVLSSLYSLALFPEKDTLQKEPIFYVGVVVGIGNIIQWSFLAAVPLIQASRLTSRCRQLRRLGLEIGSRPFVYAGTPQLDLDYFVQYTNATRYTAKLAAVPIYPWLVVGSIFLGGIIGSFIIATNNHFVFASWF